MLTVKPIVPGFSMAKYAGTIVAALTDIPPPGRLPLGATVEIAKFPALFAKIGHLYTSGSYAGNGTEGTTFKLPDPTGRFLKPRDDGSLPGTLTEDRTSSHGHSVTTDSASHANHTVTNVPMVPGWWGFVHHMMPQDEEHPDWTSLRGAYYSVTFTTGYSGDHNHSFSIANNAGAETRPYGAKLPGFVISGETPSACVAIIYGSDWGAQPGYNETIAAKTGLEIEFSKENVASYRIRYPEAAAGKPTIDTAHVEIARQLKELRKLYPDVWIVAFGAGAHLAAMAMTLEERIWIATKFVAINGVFNPSGAMNAALTTSLAQYLGGTSQALKDKATPIAPYYPIKCWHGANNAAIPTSQPQSFTPNTVVVPDLVNGANPVTAGLFKDILTFLRSEV